MLSNVEPCINMSYFRNILFSPLINRHVLSSLAVKLQQTHSSRVSLAKFYPFQEENLADTAACSLPLHFCMAFGLSVGLTIILHQLHCHPEKLVCPLAGLVQRASDSCQPWEASAGQGWNGKKVPGATSCRCWGTRPGILPRRGDNSATALAQPCSAPVLQCHLLLMSQGQRLRMPT